jgi:hypothetical protein
MNSIIMATNDKNLRIEPVYDGKGTAVKTYKVVDKDGNNQFQGSYNECYAFIHPFNESYPVNAS